jgi:pilus assembly protein FimV
MKAPVKLSLAIALALASGSAFALGLGAIQVKSGLNQPLDAEIPVITDSAAEANALTVDLASAEDFERIGLSKARLSVPLEMAVGTNAKGQTVIKLTTKEPVREPLLDFLLVANWQKGKLLREYTVLLDPPVTAPAKSTATVAPVAEKPVAAATPLAEPKPAPPPKPAHAEPKPPAVAAAPKPAPKAAPAPPPSPKPAAQPAATGNDYGPVAQGETLSEIARATRPDQKTSIDQMMLALLKANPKAFYQDNINALKRGSILRIPSGDDLKATGTLREAAEQVRSQNAAWTGKASVAAPTLVAKTGTTARNDATAAKPVETKAAKQERLALVPPGSTKNDSASDRAGSAGGTGKDTSAETKAELARTKEALTSREQEAAELKSRVKQLEDIGDKDKRLISMKDSEIADLQKKLKDLQAKAAAPAATAATTTKPGETAAAKPAEPAAGAKPDQKITAKDIWGDMNAGDKGAAKPAAGSAPSTPATAPSTAPSTPPPATASEPAAPAASTASTTAPAPSTTTSPATPADTSSSSTATSTAPATTAASDTSSAAKPAASATAPAKPTPAAKVTPLEPAAEPFYKNQSVLLGGGAALLLVGLLALMRFMRKPKPVFEGAGEGALEAGADDEELRLRDALQQNPSNTAASLELLRHYYARGDAAKFEATAETMHAHLADPGAPEWDEVLAMGSVLAPNHPLFSAAAIEPAHVVARGEHLPEPEFEYPEHDTAPAPAVDEARTHIGTFDFEPKHVDTAHFEQPHFEPAPVASAPAPAAHDDSFDFDLPIRTEEEAPAPVAPHEAFVSAPVAERQDDIYVGEDAIGTKLDLAKAYLDMGDPEGAKSMLDEVMAEGNDSQRDEARKLLAEIH